MPRPAQHNRTRQMLSPVKMAMSDDRNEKAARLQTRHALQEIHMNEVRSAASPVRRLNQARPRYHEGSDPGTPQDENYHARSKKMSKQVHHVQHQSLRDDLDLDEALNTPTNRRQVPILANFEEWMKLATDNKINATNSWNFALIDYFHDMSVLKDGPGGQVNFQKASCTLDGCVKIYTSRVDSVATETGKLLSGLADSAEGKRVSKNDNEDGEEEDDSDEDDEEGSKRKKKKKTTRSHEATLAPSFASLQLKKLELEFSVDPLFKKASADFDEGGAKGLLLNHLSIDHTGRIVFDSSDDVETTTAGIEVCNDDTNKSDDDEDIDIALLASKFFPHPEAIDGKDICPSMRTFELGNTASHPNIPSFKNVEEHKQFRDASPLSHPLHIGDQTGIFLDGSNDLGFDDDGEDERFDIPGDVGFGEGGEAWARDAAIESALPAVSNDHETEDDDKYALSLQHRDKDNVEQAMIHEYFEKAFNSRGKGKLAFNTTLENWRIQKIQKARLTEATPVMRQKKEKEPQYIDFDAPFSNNLRALLEIPAVNNSTISLPRSQHKTRGRNILDKDDELIDVKAMMRLWTKPKCRVVRKREGMAVVDDGFGSKTRVGRTISEDRDEDELGRHGDYDANFFADDAPTAPFFDGPLPIDDDDGAVDDEGVGFIDAREMLSPQPEQGSAQQFCDTLPPLSQPEFLPGSFGTQLVTQAGRRLRPEYVNYARTAKKVDVRMLKANMWKGMSLKLTSSNMQKSVARSPPATPALTNDEQGIGDVDMMDVDIPSPVKKPVEQDSEVLKFTDMIGDLRSVYPEAQMKDISTSYCFICLLHLANEKGLILDGGREDGSMSEIMVSKDPGVGAGYVGE